MQDMSLNNQKRGNISFIARLVVIIASVAMMISTILPYASVELYGQGFTFNFFIINGEFGDGLFFIVLGMLTILFAVIQKKIPLLLVAILLLLLFVYELVHAINVKNMYRYMLTFKIGFYLVRLASLIVIGSSICYFVTKKTVKTVASNTPSVSSYTTIGNHLDEVPAPVSTEPVYTQTTAPEVPVQNSVHVQQETVVETSDSVAETVTEPVSTEENL